MRRFYAFSLLVLFSLNTNLVGADTVASTNLNGEWVGINGWAWYIGYTDPSYGISNESSAQEFIVSTGGRLTTIEASVDRFEGGAPLNISVYTAVNARPGVLLGSVSVPPEQIDAYLPSPTNVFDLSSANIQLASGQRYIVTFTSAAGGVRYRARLTEPNVNSYGIPNLRSVDGGINWSTYLNVTPEIGLVVSVQNTIPDPVEATIDVNSGNSISLSGKRLKPLPVVVFGDRSFLVNSVLVSSIAIGDPSLLNGGGTSVSPISVSVGDVNGDGFADLRLTFDLNEMLNANAIGANTSLLRIEGILSNSGRFYGQDSVVIQKTSKGGGPKR